MGSLQDALLNTGLANEEQARKKPRKPTGKGGKPGSGNGPNKGPKQARGGAGRGKGGPKSGKPAGAKAPNRKERKPQSDLERAYAARIRAEKAEKEREKQARVADQEARRKRNLELDKLVEVIHIEELDDADAIRTQLWQINDNGPCPVGAMAAAAF